MLEYKRSHRVADVIQRELADLLYRRVKDPRLERVTITGVELTDDLRHARIFYCFLGTDSEKQAVVKGLLKARGFIRGELGRRLQLRYTPDLDFHFDPSFDYGAKIDRLLSENLTDE